MFTILWTLGSAGVMCVVGFGVSAGLKWFHEAEVEIATNTHKDKRSKGGSAHEHRIDNLNQRIKSRP